MQIFGEIFLFDFSVADKYYTQKQIVQEILSYNDIGYKEKWWAATILLEWNHNIREIRGNIAGEHIKYWFP